MLSPKISIITPNYNQVDFLEQTILSVIGQNYPNLEYIIIDGGSTDGSVEIIKKFEKHLCYWISEPDAGLYHAVQKGFEKSTGEIMGWINSDDKLHPGSLSVIGELFASFTIVNWLTGTPTGYDAYGRTVMVTNTRNWSKYDYYLFDYKWVQQESTFWRRSLWERAGSALNLDVRHAADFELWLRFFRHEKLFTVATILGGFRFRSSQQMSVLHSEKYAKEVEDLINAEIVSLPSEIMFRLVKYKRYLRLMKKLERFSKVFRVLSLTPYFRKKLSDAPGIIDFDAPSQRFQLPG